MYCVRGGACAVVCLQLSMVDIYAEGYFLVISSRVSVSIERITDSACRVGDGGHDISKWGGT